MYFPRWKIITVILTCLFFTLLALPNLFTEEQRAKWPSFMPSKTVSLGLDLQGGSYLLLELNYNQYLHEQMGSLVDSLRSEMIARKILYKDISETDREITFTLVDTSQSAAIKEVVAKVDNEMEVKSGEAGKITISYSESALHTKKLHLLEQSIQIVNKRVNETGTREPIIQRQGENRIVLQVPGLQDPERLKSLLGKTAKMTFHLVDENADVQEAVRTGKVPAGDRLVYEDSRDPRSKASYPYLIKSRVDLGGELLVDAAATFDSRNNEPVVSFRFNAAGAQKFGEITHNNVGKRFAVVLDGKVITAPVMQVPILDGSGIITGRFTTETANDLAVLLRSGALPVPLKVVEERSVGPSLGADSIEAGKKAALLGVVLVVAFMFINYGLFGIFADIALLVNLVFILGALSLFQATLTLPGIAGMVLTLGMAVDANVLIYERIREEQRNGKTPFAAIENGFNVARQTIFDANITTLIAALCLFYFGTGTVKGFAVTLAIGILASMFTAIVLTRLMVGIWLRRTRPKRVPI